MACFIRFGAVRTLNNNLLKSISKKTSKAALTTSLIRCINTSSKPPQSETPDVAARPAESFTSGINFDEPEKNNNWISWGMNDQDEKFDRLLIHSLFFTSISVVLIFGGTILAYMPDLKENEWTTREAYLQLRYREENGLPLVDPNLIDPSKIILPTDEELGDTEIII